MTIWINALLTELSSPLFFLLLTLSGYKAGLWLYKKSGNNTLFHPMIWSTALVALIIMLGPWRYETYKEGNALFYMLLGPATVALAVPLERQFNTIRQLSVPILISLVSGSAAVALVSVALAAITGGSMTTLLSTATKGVTTPVTLGIAETIGSSIPLAVAMVVIWGFRRLADHF